MNLCFSQWVCGESGDSMLVPFQRGKLALSSKRLIGDDLSRAGSKEAFRSLSDGWASKGGRPIGSVVPDCK